MLRIESFALPHVSAAAALERLCFSVPWTESMLRESLLQPNAFGFCAMEAGQLAGYAGVIHAAGEGQITNLCVHPEFRGKGIGKTLLQSIDEAAIKTGLECVFLEVRVSNHAAIGLYESAGYAQIGSRKQYYQAPAEDALVLKKIMGNKD